MFELKVGLAAHCNTLNFNAIAPARVIRPSSAFSAFQARLELMASLSNPTIFSTVAEGDQNFGFRDPFTFLAGCHVGHFLYVLDI